MGGVWGNVFISEFYASLSVEVGFDVFNVT